MAKGNFVSYLRVNTARQGQSGLGLDAQRKAVDDYLNGGRWNLIQEFVEVESGKNNDRAELAKAMSLCRLRNATLVIAKLDRLSRDAHFLLGLQKGKVKFIACDMPEANEMVVGMMAVIAQGERKMISTRTKEALKQYKLKWEAGLIQAEDAAHPERKPRTKLGGLRYRRDGTPSIVNASTRAASAAARLEKSIARAKDLAPIIEDIKANGASSLREIASALDNLNITTSRGKQWTATEVSRVLKRLEEAGLRLEDAGFTCFRKG